MVFFNYLPSVLWHCWLGGRKGIRPVKNWAVGCWRGYLLERGADLHMVQLMPLPLTVSCFSKIQIGFAFLVLAHLGSPGERAVKRVCVCVCVCVCVHACVCVCLSVFSCTVLFVSISQVIGCEDRLHNDLYCVEWGVKLYSDQPIRRPGTHFWNVYVTLLTVLLFLAAFTAPICSCVCRRLFSAEERDLLPGARGYPDALRREEAHGAGGQDGQARIRRGNIDRPAGPVRQTVHGVRGKNHRRERPAKRLICVCFG